MNDVYGEEQVENIWHDVEPRLRETAAATLVLEADARKKDPVHGITGIIEELNRQIDTLEKDLTKAQYTLLFGKPNAAL